MARDYDQAALSIALRCTDSRFMVQCSVINAFIDRTVQNCGNPDCAAPALTA